MPLHLMMVVLAFLLIGLPTAARTAGPPPATVANQAQVPAAPIPVAKEASTAGLEQLTENLENLVGAQANQINMLTWMVAATGVLITLLGVGLIGRTSKWIKDSVDDRALHVLEQRINIANLRSTKLNSQFYCHLRDVTQDLAYRKRKQILDEIAENNIDLTSSTGVDRLLTGVTDTFLIPMGMFTTLHEILASDRYSSHVGEKVWTLWAEVKADNVSPRHMRPIVIGLIAILEANGSQSPAIRMLRAFRRQLDQAQSGTDLTEPPAF